MLHTILRKATKSENQLERVGGEYVAFNFNGIRSLYFQIVMAQRTTNCLV